MVTEKFHDRQAAAREQRLRQAEMDGVRNIDFSLFA
jgi:hypothetical protein